MTKWSRGGLLRGFVAFSLAWVLAGALYMVLIDVTDLPELIVAVVAALLAATGFEVAREQEITGLATRVRWLARLHRPLLKVPTDIVVVSAAALRQLTHPRAARGEFRAVTFRGAEGEQLETGRRALAESLGSLPPNTIVIGVDDDRELILGHQLVHRAGDDTIDVLKLG